MIVFFTGKKRRGREVRVMRAIRHFLCLQTYRAMGMLSHTPLEGEALIVGKVGRKQLNGGHCGIKLHFPSALRMEKRGAMRKRLALLLGKAIAMVIPKGKRGRMDILAQSFGAAKIKDRVCYLVETAGRDPVLVDIQHVICPQG